MTKKFGNVVQIQQNTPTTISITGNLSALRYSRNTRLYLGFSSRKECLFLEEYKEAYITRSSKGLLRTKITTIEPIFELMDSFPRDARLINSPSRDIRDVYGLRLSKLQLNEETIKIKKKTKNDELWSLMVLDEEGTVFAKILVQCIEKK